MAVGLPIITTPVGSIPELIRNRENGFFIQPGDFQKLAIYINELLSNTPLREKIGIANKQVIQERYMPDYSMARIVTMYDRLVSY